MYTDVQLSALANPSLECEKVLISKDDDDGGGKLYLDWLERLEATEDGIRGPAIIAWGEASADTPTRPEGRIRMTYL
jgi:hypothetical protein